jgi:hypothetical protein
MFFPRLSKREFIAALICAGIHANPDCCGSFDAFAKDAVKQADTLLKHLHPTE